MKNTAKSTYKDRPNPMEKMRGWAFLLLAGLITLLVSVGNVYAASMGNQYIPADRSINWSPGIPGGIPDGYPNYNTSTWPICAKINAATYGNGVTDATSAINMALSACGDHQVVYLPAGTYIISNTLNLLNRSSSDYNGVVLRGAGPANTRIIYTGENISNGGIIHLGSASSNGYPQQVTGSINAGSNQLTVSSISNMSVGDWVSIANGLSSGVPFISSISSISSLTFAVSGIAAAPTVGATYTNNYATFTVQSTSLSGTPGAISGTITTTMGSRSPYPASGALTKSGGTGDPAIAFSSYTGLLTLSSNIGIAIANGAVSFSPFTAFVAFSGTETVIPKGSTTINVSGNTSKIVAGSYIVISENNPPIASVLNYSGTCTYCGDNNPTSVMGQIVQVTAVNGNTITINRPLYYDLDQSLLPTVTVELLTQGSGIEDIYFHPANPVGSPNILMTDCANCWVADIENDTAGAGNGTAGVILSTSYANVVRDSYIHDAYAHESGSGYGVNIFGWNSDHLIENNIFRRMRHSMIFEGGGSGVVFAYNYSINNIEALGADNYTTWDDNAMSPDSVTHGAFPYMNLYEGNVSSQLSFDNAHGNSGYNTAFRNYFTGVTTLPTGTPGAPSAWVTWGLNPVNDTWNNDNENVAANVLGVPNCGSGAANNNYEAVAPSPAYMDGSDFTIFAIGYYDGGYALPPVIDPNLPSSLLRTDNYNCINAAVPDSENSGVTIPASLYYTDKPIWWGSLPWPAIGPDLTPNVGMIPAEQRYLAIQAAGTVHMFPGDKTGDENPPGVPLTVSSSGDVSGNGKVTMYDASLVLRDLLAGGQCTTLTSTQCAAAEMDAKGNGTSVDSADVTDIAQKALGL